jgi:hypothetical protein
MERLLPPPCDFVSNWKIQASRGRHHHLLPVAAVMGSGLRLRNWMDRLLDEKRAAGLTTGFVFLTPRGKVANASDFE